MDHNWESFYYQSICTSSWRDGVFIGTLGTFAETGASLRFRNHDPTHCRLELRAEEDTTWDGETYHSPETVDYLVLSGSAKLQGTNWDLPPTADFAVSCSYLTCTFDGSASSDDIAIASYDWSLETRPTGRKRWSPIPMRRRGPIPSR